MDVLCKELFARGDFLELSKLATDLLQAQGQGQGQQGAVAAAVGWVAAGCYTQLKEGGGDQAMAFLDKVRQEERREKREERGVFVKLLVLFCISIR